jgi:hypothetical protein
MGTFVLYIIYNRIQAEYSNFETDDSIVDDGAFNKYIF